MCGIAGIVGPLCERERLERMGELLKHRGPDDFRIWLCDSEQVGFAHTRLAIIDPVGGTQPMSTTGKRFVLCYNGEIYNYLELQNELFSSAEARGHHAMYENWQSSSDAEVLLYIFQQYGLDGIQKLQGMFSFAIWDEKEDKLFAVRDRLGIKPFYYYFDGETFLFGSEIKAILAAGILPEVDEEGFSEYVELQYCLKDRTMFKNIKRLLPGHYLEFDYHEKKLSCHKYWDFPCEDETFDEEQAAEEIRFLISDSVHMHLRSDFPYGFHLSGGLDSSAICSLGARLSGPPIKAFTGGFDVDGYTELPYAEFMTQWVGGKIHKTFPTAQDLRDSLEHIIYILDEPVAGAAIFPQYFLAKLVAENHVKVALGGQGGDELFCGYVRYLIAVTEDCLRSEIYGGETAEISSGLTMSSILPNLKSMRGYEPLMKRFFSHDIFGSFSQRYYHMMLRTSGLENIISPDLYRNDGRVMATFVSEFEACPSSNIIDRMSVFDMKNHLQSLLHLEDRASMAWSIESRVPLLDHRIVEKVMCIPGHKRMANGTLKYMFKRAVKNILPPEIFNRQDKKGFPVPASEWFSNELSGWVREVLLSEEARERGIYDMKLLEKQLQENVLYDRTIWGLLSIELWFRNFFDRQLGV